MRGRIAEPEAERDLPSAPRIHSSRTLASLSRGRCVAASCAKRAGSSRASAHTAAPRTSGEASPSRRSASAASVASPELPIAISTLRTKRSRPVRFTGDLAKQRAERRVVEPRQLGELRRAQRRRARQASPRGRPARTCSTDTPRGSRRSRRCGCPSARAGRAGSGPCARWSDTRCSAAHRAGRAPETRWSGRRRGRPGTSRSDRSRRRPAASSSVVKIAPRNSHEPCSRDTRLVCLPCQPRPAAAASGFSITAAVSTNTFTSPPAFATSQRAIAFSFALISS